ncbi:MAG: hypothetical protein ACFFEY_12215 [Candidatus Thorarchaeota archaeon]
MSEKKEGGEKRDIPGMQLVGLILMMGGVIFLVYGFLLLALGSRWFYDNIYLFVIIGIILLVGGIFIYSRTIFGKQKGEK